MFVLTVPAGSGNRITTTRFHDQSRAIRHALAIPGADVVEMTEDAYWASVAGKPLPTLPTGSVLVAVTSESDLWAYGVCEPCLVESSTLMCGCDAPVSYVCVTAEGAVKRGLSPVTSL